MLWERTILLLCMLAGADMLRAQDCTATLNRFLQGGGGVDATVVSLNDHGTASYSKFDQLQPSFPNIVNPPGGRSKPTGLTGRGKQLFSDRSAQPFDLAKADDLQFDITL